MNPPPERVAEKASPPGDRPIVLFDGSCSLCNRLVRFLIERDPAGRFRFAPNDSDAGRQLLERHGLRGNETETVVLIDGERAFTRSAAALRIARGLKWPWPLFYVLIAIPRPLRDLAYTWIARNRHRWFDRGKSCALRRAGQEERFPDERESAWVNEGPSHAQEGPRLGRRPPS